MSVFFHLLRPQLAPSPLQHLLAEKQAQLSAELGFPVLLTITAGYDGTYYRVKLYNFDGDDGRSEGWDLEAAIRQASDMISGMHAARVSYSQATAADV